ncbi:MAG: hypothetical protein WAK12_05115 [Acidimicrobiales bacterium]
MLFTTKRSAALILLFAAIVAALLGGTYLFKGAPGTKRIDVVVKIHLTSRYGKILVTPRGFTIYTYQLDTKNHSNCTAFCLQVWPPLVVPSGLLPIGRDVSGLSAITRSNGERQVTFEGKPLYTYVLDHVPGRISGEGDFWSVVRLGTLRASSAITTSGK